MHNRVRTHPQIFPFPNCKCVWMLWACTVPLQPFVNSECGSNVPFRYSECPEERSAGAMCVRQYRWKHVKHEPLLLYNLVCILKLIGGMRTLPLRTHTLWVITGIGVNFWMYPAGGKKVAIIKKKVSMERGFWVTVWALILFYTSCTRAGNPEDIQNHLSSLKKKKKF